MAADDVRELMYQRLLAAFPDFKVKAYQWMMLRDAAAVLRELKPPEYRHENAAAYLEETADRLMRDAGLPEQYLQAMIATPRPPVPS